MHSQLQGLPSIVHAMLPELAQWDLAEETLADCSRCVMRPRDGESERPWHFNAQTECCTQHPFLANYLVGRALRRQDAGADRIRQRLRTPEGRSHRGLEPPKSYRERYAATASTAFGHDASLICPFRAAGPPSCSIWQDRNSTCRTWFCKSSTGLPGKRTWNAVRNVLGRIELDLATYCAGNTQPPSADEPPDAWEAWFIRCAELVDAIATDHALALRSERLERLIEVTKHRLSEGADTTLPDILVPSVASVTPNGDATRLSGYSPYDAATVSPHIFAFLSQLDGGTSWQDAAQRCHQATGFTVDEHLAKRLYALRIIREPQVNDDPCSPEAASPQHLLADS